LFVLAVDLDEWPGDLAQARCRHGLVVNSRRGAAERGHLAHADQRLRAPIEQRLDAREIRPVAHEPRIRSRPQRQSERIDEEALAGTRLAGEHVQAGGQLQSQPIDERKVGDGQFEQSANGRPDIAIRYGWLAPNGLRARRLAAGTTNGGGAPRARTPRGAPPGC
jgi:hypothetical protein